MKNLKGKRLLILGGPRISLEIIKKAQSMGIYTMVTDWYSEERSPAKKAANKAFMTSTADIEAIVELIKEEKVDGVITGFTDSTLPYYAQICQEAGLPSYGTKEQFELFTNKRRYKKLCRKFGVPVIDDYQPDFILNDKGPVEYPLLVKPADGSGANGISICNNKKEFIAAYEKALDFSESKEVIVERFIYGKEVTVFYTLQDGEVYLTAMGNRHVKDNQEDVIALPVAYTFPSIYLKKYRETVEPRVKKMFQSVGMKNGMVFMQCLVKDGECMVYDIGYRLTGSLEYKLIEATCDFNPLEMMINFALTGKMAEKSIKEIATPHWDKYACNVSFLVKPGIIDKIHGLTKIKQIPEVVDAVLARVEGEEIPKSAKGTLRQIVLRVFATASTQKELEDTLNNIYHTLKVVSSNGEEMLLDGFDTDELGGAVTCLKKIQVLQY